MEKNENRTHEIEMTVPFHDLDPLQIVWHGNYFKYFDIARFELFNNAGVDLHGVFNNSKYILPVIKTSTKHILPLKHRDRIICKATIVEARIKIVIKFEIRHMGTGTICTRSRSEQVSVKIPEMEMMYSIPDDIRKAFGF